MPHGQMEVASRVVGFTEDAILPMGNSNCCSLRK